MLTFFVYEFSAWLTLYQGKKIIKIRACIFPQQMALDYYCFFIKSID